MILLFWPRFSASEKAYYIDYEQNLFKLAFRPIGDVQADSMPAWLRGACVENRGGLTRADSVDDLGFIPIENRVIRRQEMILRQMEHYAWPDPIFSLLSRGSLLFNIASEGIQTYVSNDAMYLEYRRVWRALCTRRKGERRKLKAIAGNVEI